MPGLIAVIATLFLGSSALADEPSGPALLEYPVGARDTLAIDVFDEKNLSGNFIVDDQGCLDLPLIGRVHVSGMTSPELDDMLTGMLSKDFLVNPQVTVRISSFGSKPVQVLGGVDKPGTYYLGGADTLLEVLTMAGGVKDPTAIEIRIQRPSQGGEPLVANLDALLERGTGNIELEPGDVVYVPPGPVVYVSGEVGKPGVVPFLDGLSVIEAINRAGGATDRASMRKVFVLRNGERSRINASRILKGRAQDYAVRPDDHIYVGQSVF